MTAIHREIYGQGPALVMIHGWAMHSGVWREFARQLAQRRKVICLDLPGHGRSKGIEDFRLERITELLLAAIPVQKFSVLGWSLGATVAIDMAERFPGRVESLLILAGNPRFVQRDDWPGVKAELLDAFASQICADVRQTQLRFLALQINNLPDGRRLLHQVKQSVLECALPDPDALRAGLDILKQCDFRETLTQLPCPVNFIQGDNDTLIPLETAAAIQKLNPAINVQVLENAGHLPFLSHGPQLLEIVSTAL